VTNTPPSTTESGHVPSSPPIAERRPVTTEHHGRSRTDEYDWLRAKDDPEVTAYLEAENAWTEAGTAHLAELRGRLFDEIKARTKETDLSVPSRNRGWWYYGRSFEGREYGATCRVVVTDEADWTPPVPADDCGPDEPALPGEEVLLDHNLLAEGHGFYSVGGVSASPDGTLLAYSTDTVGDERFVLEVKDLGTGELLPDRIEGVLGGGTWSRDGTDLYYCTVDDAWRRDKVWRHRLGTTQSDDELVFHETDERFWVGLGRSRTDRFLVISSGSKNTTECRYLDTERPNEGWMLVHPRQEGLEYAVDHAVIAGEDRFLVLHNHTGADFELGSSRIAPSSPDDWEPLIPHDPRVRLEDVSAFAGHLVVLQRSGGLTQLRILELGEHGAAGITDDYLVEFPQELYTIEGGSGAQFDQPVVRLGYTSMTVPSSVYDYDVVTRELRLLKRQPVRGGYDPADYEEHRLWAVADDGERVPISLVCRRGAHDNGPIPFLLYGYGAYEISMDPGFSVPRLSLLDRGAGMAIAHVRGGGEMGRRWYDDGKLDHKQHTFSDFAACARHLIETSWTSADRLVAEGGSAGGLLMGAVANQAPELFAGFVADVPFVDALTSMLDASLPLTITEYDEWGNPSADAETYDYLAGYAPYDNVTATDYPPILATTSLNDTRVLYVEPAKWIARLRATATGRRDFLLKTEMSAGHGGVSGRYQAWHDRAFAQAWILDRMGLADLAPLA
jgi:oligopeptidase B